MIVVNSVVVFSGTFLVVVLTLTVEVIVVVSTLQLLFIIISILLNTVLIFVVNSVVVVVGKGVVVGNRVVSGALVGIDDTYCSDMIQDNFIALPAL